MQFKGLSQEEVLALRGQHGENIILERKETPWFLILFSQLKSPLIYILVIVAFVSLFFREFMDAVLLGAVIILNTLMGFFQEYSAQKTLTALQRILKPKTLVIRDGKREEINVKELVPGDLVILGSGDKIPADGKLLEGVSFLVSEAILTGEEEAVLKTTEKEKNSLFMGATVISGRGIMEVLKIGKKTEIGKIGVSLGEIKREKTPLQVKLDDFAKNLVYLILAVCAVIFVVSVFYKGDILQTFRFSIILAVAAMPEGLPIAITAILALGMRRILKRKGLVKKLLSIETLGSTSVICTDKTGTLTEGIMQVVKTDFSDKKKALAALTLNNAQRTNLEIALLEYINKEKDFNFKELQNSAKIIYEEPFDSEKKYAFTVSDILNKETAFITGAAEIVLSFCKIKAEEKKKILTLLESWAKDGLKVMGVATKEKGALIEKKNFSWLGLVGIQDPVRKEAKEAINLAQQAGIKIKIVTGDYRRTAEKVAQHLGFKLKEENIIEGKELEIISEKDLEERIDNIVLFARVTPHQKQKIVKALQDKGEIVAMTGDGVNDAPALKRADIGIVVDNASDVAKEAGDLILLDSNFKTIMAACEEGRLIFSNIKKVVAYVLSNSFAEIFLIFGATLLNLPSPLTIVQILWIHLICDGPPDIILGFEPKEKSLMEEKPEELKKESILSGRMKILIFLISLTAGLLALIFFAYFKGKTGDLKLAQTVAFATLAVVDLVYIFAFKNLKKLIIHTENFFKNKFLFLAIIYGFALTFLAIYYPPLNRILGTVPLKPYHWLFVFSVAVITTLWAELMQVLFKKN